MWKLFCFEWKKNVKNTKNLVILFLFVLLLIGYILVNMNLSHKYVTDQMTDYASDKWYSVVAMNDILNTYGNYEMPEKEQERVDFWREIYQYATSQMVYKHWRGEDRWKDIVRETIDKDRYLLQGKTSGLITYDRINVQELRNEIEKYTILYEKNIKPMESEYVMNSYNFLYRLLNQLFPYVVVTIILLICADSMSSEADTGSYKFLLLQPYRRTSIYLAKTLATITYSVVTTVLTITIVYFINGLVNGFGNANYPVAIESYSYERFQSLAMQNGSIDYSGIGIYLLKVIPVAILYLLLASVFALLISNIALSSISAMSLSVGFSLGAILLQPYFKEMEFFTKIFPVSYSNPVSVLSGEVHGTALLAVIVLTVGIVALYIFNYVLFKRKDIIC
ncbi:MAG TPA: ABC transporter permease [Lachnospiraceae bacterium]|nr:ABC transporter permease [Lachnospiraceae bacterium]